MPASRGRWDRAPARRVRGTAGTSRAVPDRPVTFCSSTATTAHSHTRPVAGTRQCGPCLRHCASISGAGLRPEARRVVVVAQQMRQPVQQRPARAVAPRLRHDAPPGSRRTCSVVRPGVRAPGQPPVLRCRPARRRVVAGRAASGRAPGRGRSASPAANCASSPRNRKSSTGRCGRDRRRAMRGGRSRPPPSGCQSSGRSRTSRTTSGQNIVLEIHAEPRPEAASATSRF